MEAFIVRPFNTQMEVDFEKVETELIRPALNELGLSGGTTGLIIEAGNIREDMFFKLNLNNITLNSFLKQNKSDIF